VSRRIHYAVGLLACVGAPVQASEPPVAISYEAAIQRLDRVSGALSSSSHDVHAAQDTADALKTLNRPIVSVSAQYLEYQKTLSLDLSGAKSDAASVTSSFLSALPGSFPAGYQEIVSQVTGRISQALPGLLSAIPDTLSYRYRDGVFRPTATAVMPLYTGGATRAVQRGAQAGVALAGAQQVAAQDLSQINLVRVYFGQQVAAQLYAAAQQTRDGFDRHLADARKLEQQGVIPHGRVLQVEVARDTAERTLVRAEMGYATARDELARLLEVDGAAPSTPLFVDSHPLSPVATFFGSGDRHPQARAADAAHALAGAGVDLAKSRQRPQAFAFGEYNFDHGDALPTEPDWVVGVGVRYTLLSNIDRRKTVDAAREHEMATADAAREARKAIVTETVRAYDLVETARRSFLLLDSSIAAAEENLRVQEVSFREGEATTAAVIDAHSALDLARAQRISTAYEYDLSLAALLAASSRLGEFTVFLARADQRLQP